MMHLFDTKQTIHNIYLGSTAIAEVERNVTNPNSQVAIDSNSTIYGYGYGDNNHKHQVKGYFDLSQVGGEIKVCVDGYGINSATEVSVTINGYDLGFLESGSTPKQSCFSVPKDHLIAGRNIVSFTQSNPGNTWGVKFISVRGVYAPTGPIMLLLLSDEEVSE